MICLRDLCTVCPDNTFANSKEASVNGLLKRFNIGFQGACFQVGFPVGREIDPSKSFNLA
jgi:hypothetical protein